MKYTLWIDNQAAGPFDVCQITELFLNGATIGSTQIRPDSAEKTESWRLLGDTFPSITDLQTRSEAMQILSNQIRSTKIPLTLNPQRVIVADFDMGFGSMVGFMVKWAIATIPAAIILAIPFFILAAIFHSFSK